MNSSVLITSYQNINQITLYADNPAEALDLVAVKSENSDVHYLIKRNSVFKRLTLRAKHVLLGGANDHRKRLRAQVLSAIEVLNHADLSAYIDPNTLTYSELYLAAQRFNRLWKLYLDPAFRQDVRLFADLCLNEQILPTCYPDVSAINARTDLISQTKLIDIPSAQEPHIRVKGKRKQKKLYHYNEDDRKTLHGKEAARIFLSTQKERAVSLMESIRKKEAQRHHYFNTKQLEIYADDKPVVNSSVPTSYWIGHASCLIHIPLKTEAGDDIGINLLTDPVEGDLNRLLYPRMTRPGRPIDQCPLPHIYLLSHNHLDHFSKKQ